jgi:predicted metal-binding protein
MGQRQDIEKHFTRHGIESFSWLDPREIVLGQWVRMKCRFGCPHYGKEAACPPYAPSVEECQRFFGEYSEAAVLHFQKAVARPEDRHAWTRTINRSLLQLERSVFLAGFAKAFVLFVDPCNLCESCAGTPADCRNKQDARPSPEALAVDVFSTVKKCSLPIRVLTDITQTMDRYGILLVE